MYTAQADYTRLVVIPYILIFDTHGLSAKQIAAMDDELVQMSLRRVSAPVQAHSSLKI